MFKIDAVINHRNNGAPAVAQLPGGFDVRVLINHMARDVRPFQVPLLRERLPAPPTTNELRMAQLHFVLGKETLGYSEGLLTGSFRRSEVVGVAHVL